MKLVTIVKMDVAGHGHPKYVRTKIIDPALARHHGGRVKLSGDGLIAEFARSGDALGCAIHIQKKLIARNGPQDDDTSIALAIGIHQRDANAAGGDISAHDLKIVTQLQNAARPGGIVLSKQILDSAGGTVKARFVSLGALAIEGIDEPVQAYCVDMAAVSAGSSVIRFGTYELDTARFELRKAGVQIAVEPQAFDLMAYLAKNNERTVSKKEIRAEIWNNRIVSEAALSSQIKAVRKALGDDGKLQQIIRTIHGRGFRFVAPLHDGPGGMAPLRGQENESPAFSGIGNRPSVAVLPLENLIDDHSQDYFADGITEDVTTALSKNRWLAVIARNSAFAFRNSTEGVRSIGEMLGANYIVTGSARKAGTRVRVSVQLVDTETGSSVWSEKFDRDMANIFDLQDDITEMVTARIESELGLTEQRKAERRPRKNLGAWDLYQLGVSEFYKFTGESNLKCQDLLRQCLELDADFASAYSRLAYAIVLSMVYFDASPDQARMDEALVAARRAIELDSQDANSYFTIGRVHLARREYDLAIDALEHAVKLNPCLAVTYCGLGDSLAYEGRLDEAIDQFENAIRLSPHDPFRWAFYAYRALAHLFRGDFDDAVLWARKSVQIPNAQYWPHAHLVAALGHLGDSEQAAKALAELMRVKPEFSLNFAREHLFYLKKEDQMETYIAGLTKAGVI